MSDLREQAIRGLLRGDLAPSIPFLRASNDPVLEMLAEMIAGNGPGGARLAITGGGRAAQQSFTKARHQEIAFDMWRSIEAGNARKAAVADAPASRSTAQAAVKDWVEDGRQIYVELTATYGHDAMIQAMREAEQGKDQRLKDMLINYAGNSSAD